MIPQQGQMLTPEQFMQSQSGAYNNEPQVYENWMPGINQNSTYNDYLNSIGMGNVTQPLTNPTTLPGTAPAGTAPVAPFGTLDQANQYGYNQALGLYNQGPNTQGFGDTSQMGQQMIYDTATGPNPYINNALGTTNQQLTQNNPFLNAFQGFGDAQNTAFQGTVDRALDNVTDRVNSQFGMAGRTNSGAHGGYMVDSLGDVANQMYSDNFQQNQNRALQAAGMGAGLYNTDQSRSLQAAGMLPGLAGSRFDDARMLTGLGATQDQMNQQLADSGWDNLQNYMNIVQGTRETQQEPGASSFDRALGLLGVGAAFI